MNLSEYIKEEMSKIKSSPFYFYTKYCVINGKKGITNLTEHEFNNRIEKLNKKYEKV